MVVCAGYAIHSYLIGETYECEILYTAVVDYRKSPASLPRLGADDGFLIFGLIIGDWLFLGSLVMLV